MTKRYDQAYFDRWYRGRHQVHQQADVRRKVALAVTTAEYFLRRSLRSLLDVGCGEGAWHPHLKALRPRAHYLGVDPSEYAIERFGRERNIVQGSFGDLRRLKLDRQFDLIVCSDVMHYVPEADIATGLREIVKRLEGMAFLEVLTEEDDIVGDLEGLIRRPAAWYRQTFTSAGLLAVGPFLWLAPDLHDIVAELERPS